MALLAAGSTVTRVSFVNACVTESQEAMEKIEAMKTAFDEAGITVHAVCRCGLEGLEKRHSESDFLILSPAEQAGALDESGEKCLEELLGL